MDVKADGRVEHLPPFSVRNNFLVAGFHRVSNLSSYLKEEQEQVKKKKIGTVGEQNLPPPNNLFGMQITLSCKTKLKRLRKSFDLPPRSPGEENGNPLQYSCLENSMDRGDWQATVHGVTELDTTGRLALSLTA